MKEANVQVQRRKKHKVTKYCNHELSEFKNLLDRQFDVDKADRVCIRDTTCLWTQEGWLYYIPAVFGLYSRKAVNLSMGLQITA